MRYASDIIIVLYMYNNYNDVPCCFHLVKPVRKVQLLVNFNPPDGDCNCNMALWNTEYIILRTINAVHGSRHGCSIYVLL